MNARGIKGLVGGLVAMILPVISIAAQSAAPPEQLEEILVEGQKPERNPEKLIEWLARLVGRYVVDGSVNLYGRDGSDGLLEVSGRSECIAFFPTAAVQCELELRWPDTKGPEGEAILGGVSNLNPAVALYVYEPNRIGIQHQLVGSDGIAEGALGYLILGSTMISRMKCGNVPGNCERVVKVTANSDLKEVEMRIDLEVEYKKAVSFRFVLHRTEDAK